jgi:Sec-independent protein translocase protein TatA
MEILGIGGWELIAIIAIMLIVAGPKRMISWSYTLGKYVGMARSLWAQTAQQLQKELNDSGVDVTVPTEIPTRRSLQASVTKMVSDVSKPVTEPVEELKKELEPLRREITPGDPNAAKARRAAAMNGNSTPKPNIRPSLPAASAPTAAPPKEEPPPAPPADETNNPFGTWGG